MTGTAADALITFALPLLLGAGLLRILARGTRLDVAGSLAWAWLLGTFGTGVVVFAGLACGAPIRSLPWLVASAAALAALAGARRPAAPRPSPVGASRVARVAFWIALAAGLLLAADRMVRFNVHPIAGGDEAWNWSNRAQAMFRSGGFGAALAAFFEDGQRIAQPSYPLLNPLLHLFTYATFDAVTHVVNRVVIQSFVPALLLLSASALRDASRPWIAATVLFLLGTSDLLAIAPYEAWGDPMVALGVLAALDAWRRWRERREPAHLRLFALALAFGAFTKPEGLMYAAFMVPAAALDVATDRDLRRALPRRALLWLAVPLAVLVAQQAFNTAHGARYLVMSGSEGGFLQRLVGELPERMPVVLSWSWRCFVQQPFDTQLFPLLFLVLLAAFPVASWSKRKVPTATLVLGALGTTAVMLGMPNDIDWTIKFASGRLILQLLPACAVWVAAVCSECVFVRAGRAEPVQPVPPVPPVPPGAQPG